MIIFFTLLKENCSNYAVTSAKIEKQQKSYAYGYLVGQMRLFDVDLYNDELITLLIDRYMIPKVVKMTLFAVRVNEHNG